MKLRMIALAIFFSLAGGTAWAKVITIGVKGMVCSFCAQGIEKKFHAQPSIDRVEVNLGQKRVSLTLKEGKDISNETITSILTESGYNVDKIERE